jgi:hypothetical protein
VCVGGTWHGVGQPDNPVRCRLLFDDAKARDCAAWREQWDAAAKEHRHDGQLDLVDKLRVEHAPQEDAAPEQPDIFPRLRLRLGQKRLGRPIHHRDARVVGGAKRAREDDDLETL